MKKAREASVNARLECCKANAGTFQTPTNSLEQLDRTKYVESRRTHHFKRRERLEDIVADVFTDWHIRYLVNQFDDTL